jgi:hypothetical protein
VLACAPVTPFRASATWPLHVARRALLRTAREIAAGLAALHAAGVPRGRCAARLHMRLACLLKSLDGR